MQRIISIHPKFAAGLDFVVGLIIVSLIGKMSSPWLLAVWFLARLVWWAVLLQLLFYPESLSRLRHFFSLLVLQIGVSLYLIFIDNQANLLLAEALLVIIPAVSFWLVPSKSTELSFEVKPLRRWRFLSVVLGVAGILMGAEALVVFQIFSRSITWAIVIFSALAVSAISVWWWWEYVPSFNKKLVYYGSVLAVLLIELIVAIATWPIGYLVSGFILAWIWYVVWLLIRFQISAEGVFWKRQVYFIVGNLILFILYLFFIVRWR